MPLFTWLATFRGSLLNYQVFEGDEAALMDIQKNQLLLDHLGMQGRLQLGLHGSMAHMTSHMALLQSAQPCHQDPVICNTTNEPSSTPTSTGKP